MTQRPVFGLTSFLRSFGHRSIFLLQFFIYIKDLKSNIYYIL